MATLQYAPINIFSLGNNVVIHGNLSTPTIQVLCMYFQCSVSTGATIKTGTTNLTGEMCFAAGGGLMLPFNGYNGVIYFEADNASDFIICLSGLAGQVGGAIMYYQF